jgi:hypothetical protein
VRRIFLGLAAVGSVLLVSPPAGACTCVPADLGRMLTNAEGAFVGTVLGMQRAPAGTDSVDYRFAVERVAKGDLGSEITVRTASSGASCGLEVGAGERTGLFVDRFGGSWVSGLCSRVDPDALLSVARGASSPTPLPGSSGWSTPAVVVLVALLWSMLVVGTVHMRRPA